MFNSSLWLTRLSSIFRSRAVLLALGVAGLVLITPAQAQLSVLSAGNPTTEWRKTQVAQLQEQLDDASIVGELREELQAQLKWLNAWKPGSLSEKPMWEAPESVKPPAKEPIIDPAGLARKTRVRLFGPNAKPTTRDTNELQEMLNEHADDVGIRQLHLHWLDQPQYRKTYSDEIADTASRVMGLLDQVDPETEEIQLAKAFCLFRRARALAYRELPEVVSKKPLDDPAQHEAMLLGAYNQLIAQVGKGRSAFVLLEVRMLRRDHFYGRALVLLTDHAAIVEQKWFLKKRRDLLTELGWAAPAKEAAEIYAKAFPEAVEEEEDER